MIRGGPEETGWREKGIHPGSGPGLLQTAVMRYNDNLNFCSLTVGKTAGPVPEEGHPGARPGRAQPNMYKDMERFEELKKIILERARNAAACMGQYGRAYRAENLEELMQVVRDNFRWACNNRVIDSDIVDAYRDEFATGKIWHNENITEGFLIASGSATVKASGSATVEAYESATVKASGSATVIAYGSATVIAYESATVIASGSATVKAYGSATVKAYGSAYVCSYSVKECQISDHAIYRIIESNTIRYVDPTIKFDRV